MDDERRCFGGVTPQFIAALNEVAAKIEARISSMQKSGVISPDQERNINACLAQMGEAIECNKG